MVYFYCLTLVIAIHLSNMPIIGKLIFDLVTLIGVIDLLIYEYGSIGSIIFSIREWLEDLKDFFKFK